MSDYPALSLFSYHASDAQRLAAYNSKVAFGEAMARIAKTDPLLHVVVSDYGRRLSLDEMNELRPQALVQAGIAEQSQVELAAALANEGFHVFAPAYAPFITARVLDQLRVMLGMMHSPVILVGLSAGYESGILGASHMALEDITALRSIPGLEVVCPTDNAELVSALRHYAASPRPAYIRLTDAVGPTCVHAQGGCFVPAEAEALRKASGSHDVAVLVTGAVTGQALAAAELLAAEGISCSVTSFASVKPLDTAVIDELCGHARLLVSIEEHSIVGGFGSTVAEHLVAGPSFTPLLRLGAPDYYFEADHHEPLLERAGLLAPQLAASIRSRLAEFS